MDLNPADTDFLNTLKAGLPDGVIREPAPQYLQEPRGRWHGQAGAVLMPETVEEVSTIVKAANSARVPVIPYGGGTGLVGGQVFSEGPAPIILSLERMRAIRALYPTENVIVAEAGVILEDLQNAADEISRLFPLSIAAKGSARIGGILSTNAGGVNVLRYGNARNLCLGLEAVLPNGDIWHGLKRLRKDNMGYDLKDLLIGAEGTLGVITAATLTLSPRPATRGVALMVVPDPEAALNLLALARNHLGEAVSAFELMHRTGLDFLTETMPELQHPFADTPEWFVLIDVGLARGLNPDAALEMIFADALKAGCATDGLIAQSGAHQAQFWQLRENIPEGNRRIGSISSHDVYVPLSAIPDFIRQATQRIAKMGPYRINCFGHLGDGNLHFNVFAPKGEGREAYRAQAAPIQRCIHDLVHGMGGSIAAEHGVGRLKIKDMKRYCDPVALSAMRALKAALDPNGIMNPGAVLE